MKDRPMSKRKPKTQSGFASFDMQEFAEMLVIGTDNKLIKPKQNDQVKRHGLKRPS